MLAEFGETAYSLLLAILATYWGNAIWWKKQYVVCMYNMVIVL